MIYPDKATYLAWAGEYDVVPVCCDLLADTETPVSVYARFQSAPYAFLLESVEGGETWGRYSVIGVDPRLLLDADHGVDGPAALEPLRAVYRGRRVAPVPGLPRFFGGAVGYVGYEAMSCFERMPAPKPGGHVRPRSRFVEADKVIVFDNVAHTVKLVVCTQPRAGDPAAAYAAAVAAIEQLAGCLRTPVRLPDPCRVAPPEFTANMTRADYTAMVRRAKEYIFAGDIIQAVLSQRFAARAAVPPLDFYRALRLLNPSPYMFCARFDRQTLVGASPEVMVRLADGQVALRPIAGTRPRGATAQEDATLAAELLADEKEKAEHVMLVDLGRNDVGRVAEPGSVEVSEFMVVERYSHVMHLVSHVRGRLRPGCDAYDVLKATFPAGTLTGAPKIRAMEIIHELEPGPRGTYGGAFGYVAYDGGMDLAITIRTLDIEGDRVAVQAGAGIVFDSDPDREFEETCHKARALQRAVAIACNGLELTGGPARPGCGAQA